MDERDREYQKVREINYVLWTVIAVLGITLINLFSQETCQNKVFVDQVSFASTISSIILSVIAIIMTVVSNDTIGSLLHRFRDLHDDIKEVPEELRKTVKSFNSSCKELEGIEQNLNILPAKLEEAKGQITTVSELIQGFVDRLNSIEERTTLVNETLIQLKDEFLFKEHTADSSSEKNLNLSDNDIKLLISNLPYMGKVVLYSAVKCFEDNKILDFELLSEQLHAEKNIGYFLGVLTILKMFNLVSFKVYKKNMMTCVINHVHEIVKDNINMFDPLTTDERFKEANQDAIKNFLAMRKSISEDE